MTRIYDVSVPIRSGGLVYPGNPEIRIELQQALAKGNGANVSNICFGSHTGTHVDAAKHFFDDGQTVDALPLGRLIGPARVIAFSDDIMCITRADLENHDLAGTTRVLLKTRNSALLSRSEFQQDYTYLAPDGAEHLVSLGIELVGVDYFSVEQFHSGHHRTHRTLLEQQVVIIEALDLSAVAAGEYQLVCLPLRIEGLDGAPARVVLVQ